MKFNTLYLDYEGMKKQFDFSSNNNLVYSKKNSVGKSTLLRILLFSLGYAIPGTKGIKFEKLKTILFLEIGNRKITLIRNNNNLELIENDISHHFLLPDEDIYLLQVIFNSENKNVLENILGSIYLDQEKGWTLLNKGFVIGRIYFNLYELVGGLAERNIEELQKELNVLKQEKSKYIAMRSIYFYQTSVIEEKSNLEMDYIDKIENDILLLELEKKQLMKDLNEIERAIEDNESFLKFIEKMKIAVEIEGKSELVTKDNIVGFEESQLYIYTKKKLIEIKIKKIKSKISKMRNNLSKEYSLLNLETELQKFDSRIMNINLDFNLIEKLIKEIETKEKYKREVLRKKIIVNNNIISELYESIADYAKRLGIEQYLDLKSDFIFTNNLKRYSGAVLHKLVFAFKLSYIKSIQKYLGISLPILLDSPSGREVDKQNIEEIFKILKEDFNENQIILASIFDNYKLDEINVIEIKSGIFKDNEYII
ncbi:hypothetical protein SASK131_07860 [Staphylococcus argenteus]